jgi:RNA polymerase sigma factor (TIGR02999 family)
MDPSRTGSPDIAELLARWSRGDRAAFDVLVARLYKDMHAIAVRQLRDERQLTIQPTALVNEVYLRLVGLSHLQLRDRAHFLSIAARIARQSLVDEARRRRASKRGGGDPVTLSDANLEPAGVAYDAVDVDDLLTQLQHFDALAADVVTLRVFGGLSIKEVAEALSSSVGIVNRRWATGKAWLSWELQKR